MSRKKSLFLVDVDNTLIDTEGIKSLWRKRFKNRFLQAYESSKSVSGFLDIQDLARRLFVEPKFFYNTPFKKFLFPGSKEFLKQTKKQGRVVIFSLGDGKYQKLKIAKSGIGKVVGKNNVIITNDKMHDFPIILQKFRNKDYSRIFIIDDRPDMLRVARNSDPSAITVWVKYGKYGSVKASHTHIADFEAKSLAQAGYFTQNFIDEIKGDKTIFRFSIFRDITPNQIKQLLKFSSHDKKVQQFTNDKVRFKNSDSFNGWGKLGKTIYTLSDKKQNLCGIIWFSANKYNDFDHTFAIRLYPPARGKGLALPFMRVCFADFNKKRIWLTVRKDNLKAIATYKKFGFSEAEHTSDRTIMTLG